MFIPPPKSSKPSEVELHEASGLFTGVRLSELGEKWLRSWSAESGTGTPSSPGSSRAGPHRRGVSASASPPRTLPLACSSCLQPPSCLPRLPAILQGRSQVGDVPGAGQGVRGVKEREPAVSWWGRCQGSEGCQPVPILQERKLRPRLLFQVT